MPYRFKSTATADLTLLEDSAKQVLRLIGKSTGPQGVISPEEVPAAVQALEQAVAIEAARERRDHGHQHHPSDPESEAVSDPVVSLRQRAAPFIHMLREAEAAGARVTWGV